MDYRSDDTAISVVPIKKYTSNHIKYLIHVFVSKFSVEIAMNCVAKL